MPEALAGPVMRRLVHGRRSSELFVVRAASRLQLADRVRALDRFLEANLATPPASVAEALNRDAAVRDDCCVALVAGSVEDLRARLAKVADALSDSGCHRIADRHGAWYFEDRLAEDGGVAALFPGEGSQYERMLEELGLHFDVVRHVFDLAQRAYGDPGATEAGMERDIAAVFTADLAVFGLLRELGLRPDAVVGHSAGEFAALVASGAADVHDEDALIHWMTEGLEVAEAVQREGLVPAAGLIALGNVDAAQVGHVLAESRGGVHLAMDNCPHQVVICGADDALDDAVRALGPGAIGRRLPFRRPYHTPLFAGVTERLESFYAGLQLRAPDVALWSCATATPFPDEPAEIRRIAREQWMRPVRFRETVAALYDSGIRVFVEHGPGATLTSFVDDTLGGLPHVAVAIDRRSDSLAQLHRGLGLLIAHGVPLDLSPLYAGRVLNSLPDGRLWDANGRAASPAETMPLHLALPRLGTAELPAARPRRQAGGMAAYTRTMEQFLDLQHATFAAALRGRQDGRGPTVRTHSLDLERDRWLRDHTLGPRVSLDDSLTALPVLPLAVAVELMAAAAADALPGRGPVAVEDVQARHWLAADDGRLEVEVRASSTGGDAVDVDILQPQPSGSPSFAVRGVVRTGDRPPPPSAGTQRLEGARRWPWPQETLYEEGRRRGMFHGPAFQGVVTIDRVGDDGAEATLRCDLALPDHLGRERSWTAPGVVDAAGQVLGFWAAEALETAFVIFPTGFASLAQHVPPAALPEHVRCVMRVRDVRPAQVVAEVDLITPDGGVVASIRGWTASRHALPDEIYAYCIDPARNLLGRVWAPPLDGAAAATTMRCTRVTVPPALLDASGGIWEQVLAHIALGRVERARWRELTAPARRREWLLGRIAAKDAVRALDLARTGSAPYPADIEIATDERSAPHAVVSGAQRIHVSISHADGIAAAIAADPASTAGIGIDIEVAGRDTSRIEGTAFDGTERGLMIAASAGDGWPLRAWCAKEAAAKAIGLGLVHGPSAVRIGAVASGGDVIELEPADAVTARDPELAGVRLAARTVRDGDLIVSTAIRKDET